MLNLVMTAALATSTPEAVRLDGRFDEWPEASSRRPALTAASDDSTVYLLMELPGAPVNLQGLQGPMTLQLDWDGQQRTGRRGTGADIDLIFSPSTGRGGGVAIAWPGDRSDETHSWDTTDLTFAPTTASDRFEIALPRRLETPAGVVEVGQAIRWILERDGSKRSSGTASLGSPRPAPSAWMSGPLPAPVQGSTRVVAWNLERGNFVDEAETVTRLLRAMQPQVLLVQELSGDHDAKQVRRILQDALPGRRWTVAIGAASGSLRSAVATSLKATPVEPFENLRRAGESRRAIRVAALQIDVPGVGDVLTVSAHLKCCGVVGGPEDLTRMAEVMAIRHAVQAQAQHGTLDGLIVGGDLNLVGGQMPLDMLAFEGTALLDPDVAHGEDLVIIDAWQPDGSSLTTWQKPDQPYSPGRLDFILVDPTAMSAQGTVVLDTTDFDNAALGVMGLRGQDTATASDHLPVIVDLVPARK